jgi:HK97 family phage prohead protease
MDATKDLIRNVPFEVTRATEDGDGLTLEGYAAVFDSPTEINSWEGRFIERIKPGAFTKTLSERMPVLMFNHGQHPLIGDMPIGVIQSAREDSRGLFIKARLASNWLIEPVREAISQRAVNGMSFRFSVPTGKDVWRRSKGELPERDVTELKCPELGPVVFPAYADTEVGVRSLELPDADKITKALAKVKTPKRDLNGWTLSDLWNLLSDAVADTCEGDYCYVSDISDTWLTYRAPDPDDDGTMCLFKVDFTVGADGAVTLGTPTEVIAKTTFLPATDEAAEDGTSDSAGMQMNSNEPPAPRHSVPDPQAARRARARRVIAQYRGVNV